MSFLKVKVHFIKENKIKLLEKIKVDKKGNDKYFYFHPEDQFLCSHANLVKKIPNFKNFLTVSYVLNHPHYLDYLNSDYEFEFNNRRLFNEIEYKEFFNNNSIISDLVSEHSNCLICKSEAVLVKKEIRKRKKLSSQNLMDISHDLGVRYKDWKILKHYNISKTTLLKIKKNRKNQFKKTRSKSSISSLTSLEQDSIINLVKSDPFQFNNPFKIKNFLKLKCHPQTIRNLLRKNDFNLRVVQEIPYLTPLNLKLKEKFCNLVKDLSAEEWFPVVFTDEKIIQSFNNCKYRVFRTKFQKGKRFDKRFIFRKEKQARCKLNLFSYVTSKGVGELFVFKNKAKGLDYKNNLNDFILPSIRRKLGHNNFILQQDNASVHNCSVVYDYLKQNDIKLLIWPPKCPMFNIIENCWAMLQHKVNLLINKYGQPKTDHALFRYCLYAWKSIDLQQVLNLYNSIPKRINDFLKKGV